MRWSSLFVILALFSCAAEDMTSQKDANGAVISAVSYKAQECRVPIPQPYILVVDDVPTRNLLLCTTAIIQSECPFVRYPIACALLYIKEPVNELPPLIPFKAYIENKL